MEFEDDEPDTDPLEEDWESDNTTERCCFPGRCCMPGIHFLNECCTAEMLEQMAYDGQL